LHEPITLHLPHLYYFERTCKWLQRDSLPLGRGRRGALERARAWNKIPARGTRAVKVYRLRRLRRLPRRVLVFLHFSAAAVSDLARLLPCHCAISPYTLSLSPPACLAHLAVVFGRRVQLPHLRLGPAVVLPRADVAEAFEGIALQFGPQIFLPCTCCTYQIRLRKDRRAP